MAYSRLLILHAITPLHVGTGRGEGIIDLPVAREVVTKHPIIPGSGVKGPLRAACPEAERQNVFGPDTNSAHEHASAVRFSDARLLAMPCPSDHGTFAWVSSPMVLARWKRDLSGLVDLPAPPAVAEGTCACAADAAIRGTQGVVLDGQPLSASNLAEWPERLAALVFPTDAGWRELFRARFAVVSDEAFNALARNGTDVRAHICIDPDSGTVKGGALWYEESVPAEAIFASVVHLAGGTRASPAEAEQTLSALLSGPITFGGGKTTGMGVMRGHLLGGVA